MARTCFAFTLSGMYLFQLPAPFFFSQLRFCRALKILSTTPATCLSFRPWQDPVNEELDQGLFFVNCQYPYVTTRNNFPAEMMLYCPGIVAKFHGSSLQWPCSPCSCLHDNMPQLSGSPPSPLSSFSTLSHGALKDA